MLFTLIDGSYLVLDEGAKYEIVPRRQTIEGGSPSLEIRRLEEITKSITNAAERLKK